MDHGNTNTALNKDFIDAMISYNQCEAVFGITDIKRTFALRYASLTPLEYIIVIYITGE